MDTAPPTDAFILKDIPFRDPASAFAPLAGRPHAVFLDSAQAGPTGRHSIIAADPFRVIDCSPFPWRVRVDGREAGGDPFAVLEDELARFRLLQPPPPFAGGAIGFLGYELGGVLERLPPPKTAAFPADMVVGLYDAAAVFDHAAQKAWVVSTGFPETGLAARRLRAEARARWLEQSLGVGSFHGLPPPPGGAWRAAVSRAGHEAAVAQAIDYIRAGDIFQANITQRWTADLPPGVSLFQIYRRLRALAPAPFAAFLNLGGGMHLLSASPERFLALDAAGHVETRPIKGTRPRGRNDREDAALAGELLSSAKDRAENLMIVDLLRNDLSRVCETGSVAVPQLCALETFPAVHHLVSAVTGRLRGDKTAVDLLRAAFPGGSVTGAPKIRAMEVIHELETSARGPYCGAVFHLGFDGAMDSSIVIRTLAGDGRGLCAQAGGGIVSDSDPAREYEESVIKARPLLRALTEQGIP